MTDKEQIIIDGVDVSECKHFCLETQIPEIPLAGYSNICCEENIAKECKDNPNCYFKQLARKTAECKELKEQLKTSEKWRINAESLNEKLDIKNARYRKALEEIEGIAKNFGSYAAWQEQRINKILDIINKAKGE